MTIPRSAFLPDVDPEWAKSYKRPRWLDEIRIDGNVVFLTRQEFNEIPEYSTTMPTGVYQGKVIKSRHSDTVAGTQWSFRWMVEFQAGDKRMIRTEWLPLIVLENH